MHFSFPEELKREYRDDGYWTDERLLDYAARYVERSPDALLIIDEVGSLSWQQAWDQALALAGWLRSAGVEPGTVVSVQLPNRSEYAVVLLAVDMVGAVLNPLLTQLREHDLRHILSVTRSRVLFVPARQRERTDFIATAEELMAALPELSGLVAVGADGIGLGATVSWEVAIEHPAIDPASIPDVDFDAPTVVCFTSGTESGSKGCAHSHNTGLFFLRNLAIELGLTGDALPGAVFMPAPLGAALGIMCGLRLAVYLGRTIVVQDKWDPAVAADLISRHRCVYALGATPFVRQLVDHVTESHQVYDFSAFRYFVCGGAAIPRDLITEAEEAAGFDLLAVYGQAECYAITLVRPSDPPELKASCDGWALPGVRIRVVDELGDEVPPGEPGECITAGPHIMLGYLNPPPDAPPAGQGHWLHTGDLVTVDELGYLSVVGRKKEIIIRGGVNISPREVEEMLLRHPAVADVAVMPYPDRVLGERCCAVIVAAGPPPRLEELTAFLSEEGLAIYKLPERVELLDEIPRNSNGKMQKVLLREWLAAQGLPAESIAP